MNARKLVKQFRIALLETLSLDQIKTLGKRLYEIATDEEGVSTRDRIKAAEIILTYYCGRPSEYVDDEQLEEVTTIRFRPVPSLPPVQSIEHADPGTDGISDLVPPQSGGTGGIY